jgi:hypothetical protein
MHAPYAAQYCVMGGSGAGSGGSFTLDAAFACNEPFAPVSDAPLSALVADAAVAAVATSAGFADEAAIGADAPATVAAGALAPGSVAAAGMLALTGAGEKVLEGSGGRDGTPVDEIWVAGGLRGGSCDSRTMLTLVCLFACA